MSCNNCKSYNGIVIFGAMASGKDTVAEIIQSKMNDVRLYNIGFICRELMKVTKVNPTWSNKDREFAQLISTKLREVEEDILNDYTYAKILENDSFPVVVGGRTVAEHKYWTDKGYLSIGVDVDDEIRIKRLIDRDSSYSESSQKHATEINAQYIVKELCDTIICNNSNLEALEKNISKCLYDFDILKTS